MALLKRASCRETFYRDQQREIDSVENLRTDAERATQGAAQRYPPGMVTPSWLSKYAIPLSEKQHKTTIRDLDCQRSNTALESNATALFLCSDHIYGIPEERATSKDIQRILQSRLSKLHPGAPFEQMISIVVKGFLDYLLLFSPPSF